MEKCFKCKGPYHPATGHIFFSPNGDPICVYCHGCTLEFIKFYKGRMATRKRKGVVEDFYGEAVASKKI